ncbi:hypothetical protein GCM10010995_06030 [Cysteiniphilum litorale]|uniref:DotM C-terminal cytoplasmic domain-containing protein n=1 Tax=Cysteiniphilum litorale TaxID=2056700 RepID=A0A8J2Z2S5_9GAMM|nr:hypothetical protein GCM10010995_06030 [Cysteiniphilum litorale]
MIVDNNITIANEHKMCESDKSLVLGVVNTLESFATRRDRHGNSLLSEDQIYKIRTKHAYLYTYIIRLFEEINKLHFIYARDMFFHLSLESNQNHLAYHIFLVLNSVGKDSKPVETMGVFWHYTLEKEVGEAIKIIDMDYLIKFFENYINENERKKKVRL